METFASPRKQIIIIAGPTASGKTDIAIDIAKHFNTEIISADSRQCFKELNIGVAKPSLHQLSEVPHHFINSHKITEYVTAADFEKFALQAAETIFENHDTAIMCGGTGLYIKAFCEGLDEIPKIHPSVKKIITDQYREEGLLWLQQAVEKEDPQFFREGESQNPHRLLRALEVMRGTGKSILEHQTSNKKQRSFDIVKIALDVPRDILYNRINDRVDVMIREGLQAEAFELFPVKELNALQTVGYRELFEHFENSISLDKAIELIKQNTRNYAKRQLTWFRKDKEFLWLKPGEVRERVISVGW